MDAKSFVKSATSQNVARPGITLAGATFLALLVMKLGGWSVIPLSWFWVFFPLWIGLAVVLGVVVAFFILAGIATGIAAIVGYFLRRSAAASFQKALKASQEDAKKPK